MKLSYIIPAYNVSLYIERCINSVYEQELDLDEFEIIVVDDGSTDNTLAILQKLLKKEKYSNLKVFHQNNMGPSSARNFGLDKAVGEYIWFIDADDYIRSDSVKNLFEQIEKFKPDLLFFRLLIKRLDSPLHFIHDTKQPLPKSVLLTGEETVMGGFIPGSACSALIKRSFIIENGLTFLVGIFHEDTEFIFKSVCLSKYILFTDFAPYIYETHLESRLREIDKNKILKRKSDTAIIANSFINFANKFPKSCKLHSKIIEHGRSMALGTILSLLRDKNFKSRNERDVIIREMRRLKLFPLIVPTENLKKILAVFFLNLRFYTYGK